MHFAFKFPAAFKLIDCEKWLAAGGAKILEPLPIMLLSARRTLEMGQKHKFNQESKNAGKDLQNQRGRAIFPETTFPAFLIRPKSAKSATQMKVDRPLRGRCLNTFRRRQCFDIELGELDPPRALC
jgi:hypothetical protein